MLLNCPKSTLKNYDSDEIEVHAKELEKDGSKLRIKIEWKEGLPLEEFCLKSNIQMEKITDQFIDMLMKATPNSTFSVPDRSPADLIQRSNLRDAGLKELFLENAQKNILLSKELGLKDKL